MPRDRLLRRARALAALPILALLAAACGGTDQAGLNFYVLGEPSGSFEAAAEDCSTDEAPITVQTLPADADQQREQLVRRLAAGDTSIDLIGMDVIWTAEFAQAEWILPFEGQAAEDAVAGRIETAAETVMIGEEVYGAPFTSNTQLLWYRSDLVPEPPATWDELFTTSEDLAEADDPAALQGQGNRYEGLTVFFNTLLASAGGSILTEDGEVGLEEEPTRRALDIMRTYATGPAAPDALSTSLEDSARLAFEEGSGAYMVNYPFVWPSAEENAPELFEVLEYTAFPAVTEGEPARVTIGGINVGVGAFTSDEEAAFEAAACIANEDNQRRAAIEGGLPPTIEDLYSDPELEEPYPFADQLLEALQNASLRPKTPRYNDVSLAIAGTLHPMSEIDEDTYDELVANVERALAGEGLL